MDFTPAMYTRTLFKHFQIKNVHVELEVEIIIYYFLYNSVTLPLQCPVLSLSLQLLCILHTVGVHPSLMNKVSKPPSPPPKKKSPTPTPPSHPQALPPIPPGCQGTPVPSQAMHPEKGRNSWEGGRGAAGGRNAGTRKKGTHWKGEGIGRNNEKSRYNGSRKKRENEDD